MFLVLIDTLRYMINGLFAFSNLKKSNKYSSLKIITLSAVYTMILTVFKFFVVDNQTVIVVYTLLMLGILMVTTRPKNFKFSILYSLFVTCLTEYIHFLFFGLLSINVDAFGISEVTVCQPERLLISRAIVFILYSNAILLIYISRKVDIDFIKKASQYRVFPIFSGIALFVMTYLKYHIKYTKSNNFHYTLLFILAIFMLVSFIFMFSSETFLNIIESLSKNKINTAIEEAKLQKCKGFIGLKFTSEELNLEVNRFLNMLGEINMDIEDKKSKQIAYCAVLLNHEENPQDTNMISVIYPIVGDILDRQAKTIESNISNAIKTHWTSCSAETLEKINKNYKKSISPESGYPGAKEFLLYLIQRYKDKYPENESKSNTKYSFFKKYLLNIQN